MLNIFDLNNTRDEKEIKKVEIYKNVLNKIHSKIKLHSKKSVSYVIYIIPKIILGLPLYNQISCAEYCIDKLKKNGFIVIYTYPNMLYVCWEHIPSKLKNPDVAKLGEKIITNPYKDYSEEVFDISDMSTNKYLSRYYNAHSLANIPRSNNANSLANMTRSNNANSFANIKRPTKLSPNYAYNSNSLTNIKRPTKLSPNYAYNSNSLTNIPRSNNANSLTNIKRPTKLSPNYAYNANSLANNANNNSNKKLNYPYNRNLNNNRSSNIDTLLIRRF